MKEGFLSTKKNIIGGIAMNKRKKISFFHCIFTVLLIFFLFKFVKQEIQIYEINNEIGSTNAKITDLSLRYNKLQEEYANSDKIEYIEKVAREEYNMVKEREVPILVKE